MDAAAGGIEPTPPWIEALKSLLNSLIALMPTGS